MVDKINYFIYRLGGQKGKELLTVLKGRLFAPHYSHPGLADRLKAILGCYYIAKQNGYSFKIVWREPFPLGDFLSESQVRWLCDGNGPAYSIRNTRFFIYSGLRKGLDCKLRPNKEYVCCCYKGDDLFYVNGVSDFDKRFGSPSRRSFIVCARRNSMRPTSPFMPLSPETKTRRTFRFEQGLTTIRLKTVSVVRKRGRKPWIISR